MILHQSSIPLHNYGYFTFHTRYSGSHYPPYLILTLDKDDQTLKRITNNETTKQRQLSSQFPHLLLGSLQYLFM